MEADRIRRCEISDRYGAALRQDVGVESLPIVPHGRGFPLRLDERRDPLLTHRTQREPAAGLIRLLQWIFAVGHDPRIDLRQASGFVERDRAGAAERFPAQATSWRAVAEHEGLGTGGRDADAKAFQVGIPQRELFARLRL